MSTPSSMKPPNSGRTHTKSSAQRESRVREVGSPQLLFRTKQTSTTDRVDAESVTQI